MKREQFKHPLTQAMAPLILGLCRHPDSCRITEALEPRMPTLNIIITPHRADYRMVNGTGGRQIKALKYFAQRAGELMGVDADVRLEEGTLGTAESGRDFEPNPEFDMAPFFDDIRRTAKILFGRDVELNHERIGSAKVCVYIDVDPSQPEDIPSVFCLSDLFYPASVRNGLKCDIRPPRRVPT